MSAEDASRELYSKSGSKVRTSDLHFSVLCARVISGQAFTYLLFIPIQTSSNSPDGSDAVVWPKVYLFH